MPSPRRLSLAALALLASAAVARAEPTLAVDKPMPAPAWALVERALLQANAEGVEAFTRKFVDGRGYLKGPEHWGITDGPDDSVEPIRNWPLAYALGGPDTILKSWQTVWEGHLDQYSRAKVPEVASARDGIYQREFTPSFDWEHIGEGLSGFYFYGLAQPDDPLYVTRLRRFAGFYLNEDPAALNYDPQRKIIRSLFNGSKGPNLGEPSPIDWDGPPVPGGNPERQKRFVNATNIKGDHPLNLASTNLAMTAYMATGDAKYRTWLLTYVDAWKERTKANGGNIPSNIGLDGSIGGEWGGKWYGGVFGWNSPDSGVRNYVLRGPPEGFGNALLLTGDQGYTAVLRKQLDNLYAQKKVENGKTMIPVYYGDKGWYGYYDVAGRSPGLGNRRKLEADIYLWDLNPADLARAKASETKPGWLDYLQSGDEAYAVSALQAGLEEVRVAGERIRKDDTTIGFPPDDTRWSDSNPVATEALINLTMGAADPGGSGHGPLALHAQVRHFDPEARRPGLPDDVAALVRKITPETVTLTLVNTNPLKARTVTVQMGAYGENDATTVKSAGGASMTVNASWFNVRLAPGAGETLTIGVKRYAHQPSLTFPWNR
ncbi:hypothetical protein [Caulobacter segnis]